MEKGNVYIKLDENGGVEGVFLKTHEGTYTGIENVYPDLDAIFRVPFEGFSVIKMTVGLAGVI